MSHSDRKIYEVFYCYVSGPKIGGEKSFNDAANNLCTQIAQGYEIYSAIATPDAIHYILRKKMIPNDASNDQAVEASDTVAYNPDSEDDVVAIEPPIIPIMRSGHEPEDL